MFHCHARIKVWT